MSKLSEETAKDVFHIFLDHYELEDEEIDDEQKAAFALAERRIIKAIRKGRLEIEAGPPLKIVQTLKNPLGDVDKLEYAELTGKAKVEMQHCKDTDNFGRMYALVGSLTGIGKTGISKLTGVDLSLCECMALYFLAV